MDQATRNKLRAVVTQCRRLLEDAVSQELQGKFGVYTAKKDEVQVDDDARMSHLTDEERAARKDILDHFAHIKARGFKPKEALEQLVREIAYTHLNRLCAYKMMEARQVYVGDQKFREAVSRGVNSNGVKFYLADHPDDERLYTTGNQELAYRHFLDWLGGLLSEEIGVLFSPHDPANRLYPPQRVLDEVLDLVNDEALAGIWEQDETIGWIYQYFTPKELRDQARKESRVPRDSYELAFRNQFFTPRYVVEFLTDNTLGRIWYEMRKGDTKLKDQCRYMVRRQTEVFLKGGEQPPKHAVETKNDLSQAELLKLPVYISHRPKKDPRELKILDPACGSGHFLLYCFDLLLTIYEEAYTDPELGPALQRDYPTLEALHRDVPRLILARNLHGIDIDLRASQIAALALWLRCQRAYQEMGRKKDRPAITRSNFVCAEPMPGEQSMLKEFVGQLEPKLLGQLVEVIFDKMKLAGEAGSLLRIEADIREVVAGAKRQWLAGPVPIQRSLFDDDRPVAQQQRFDFSGITDAQFFEQAEAKVVETLRDYAERAQNGQQLQRKLFAEDAVRGFAFVDLCHQQFDVVLMNPPFGEVALGSRQYLYNAYHYATQDIFAAFVDRGIDLLVADGCLGAITSRLAFFLELLEGWRQAFFGESTTLTAMADLGYGVLDAALVEAAAYTITKRTHSFDRLATFINLLASSDKADALLEISQSICVGSPLNNVHMVSPKSFKDVPGTRASYWVSDFWRGLFRNHSTLQSHYGFPHVGLQTGDDSVFLRLQWEVPTAGLIGKEPRWVSFAKGGEYSPFYGDYHLLFEWTQRGLARRQSNSESYFRPGVTYTQRTTSNLSFRLLPAGCIFSPNGVTVVPAEKEGVLDCCIVLNTRMAQFLVEMCVGSGDAVHSGSAARNYGPRIVARIPIPDFEPEQKHFLRRVCADIWQSFREQNSVVETDRYFLTPFALSGIDGTLTEMAKTEWCEYDRRAIKIIGLQYDAETVVNDLLGICGDYLAELERVCGAHPQNLPQTEPADIQRNRIIAAYEQNTDDLIDEYVRHEGASRNVTKKAYVADRQIELIATFCGVHPRIVVQERQKCNVGLKIKARSFASRVISYAVGIAYGVWDVRQASAARVYLQPLDALAVIPPCQPGRLLNEKGLPAEAPPEGYVLRVSRDGILVDDSEHADDIIRRLREVFEVIWKGRSEEIEKEACSILAMNDLRTYFRRPSKGGFWDEHISRYSKSRRSAPIYWLLQSSKKNYALWLYYHRLDKDLLFKALVNYVEPKIRLEDSRLETLRTQKAAAGGSGRDAKRLGKEVERLEEFLSELRDFEDKLRRVANLHLVPDLNDGVVLNIAPLWELVPWKEAKNYWDELLDGGYEWSSIAKQLRQKELVK